MIDIDELKPFNKIAVQVSGGKDSMLVMYLLKDYLIDLDIQVYHMDTGDPVPETQKILQDLQDQPWCPPIHIIQSDVESWRLEHGIPSDLVPANGHHLAHMYGFNRTPFKISNRFDCCYFNLMLPMHERMLADGMDCVIRGTKFADGNDRIPAQDDTDYYHVYLPIKNLSDRKVIDMSKQLGVPQNPVYECMANETDSAPECLNCSAWWHESSGNFLKKNHPKAYANYIRNINIIATEVNEHAQFLTRELEELEEADPAGND